MRIRTPSKRNASSYSVPRGSEFLFIAERISARLIIRDLFS